MKIKIAWVLLILGLGFGIYWLGVTIYFYGLYISQFESSGRYELLMGVAIGSMFATPGWCIASVCATLLKQFVNRLVRNAIYITTLAVFLSFLYFLIFD